jgi:hypothetical protein
MRDGRFGGEPLLLDVLRGFLEKMGRGTHPGKLNNENQWMFRNTGAAFY